MNPEVGFLSVRVILILLAMLMFVIVPAREGAAQGRRARLSDDLARRLQTGDDSETSVILTGSPERIDEVAARHGLQIQKRLFGGAVVNVPKGALDRVTRDAALDHVSGNTSCSRRWRRSVKRWRRFGGPQVLLVFVASPARPRHRDHRLRHRECAGTARPALSPATISRTIVAVHR